MERLKAKHGSDLLEYVMASSGCLTLGQPSVGVTHLSLSAGFRLVV